MCIHVYDKCDPRVENDGKILVSQTIPSVGPRMYGAEEFFERTSRQGAQKDHRSVLDLGQAALPNRNSLVDVSQTVEKVQHLDILPFVV
jgi:hypothetical protein